MKKLYAVIGDPIGHSMSPIMHNDLFSHYQLDAHYFPFQVKGNDLETAVKGLKVLGTGGFNVTVPHKSAIIPFLDDIDELALSIGAVNTVVNENGKFKGYNTDGPGFLKALHAVVPALSNQKILIIGAGGAARGIYFTLAKEKPAVLDIANRTKEKAIRLIDDCPFSISSTAFALNEATSRVGYYDVIIQTSMIGMAPKIDEIPMDLSLLNEQTVVCDIIYNPLETKLLQEAKSLGAIIQNGVDMFAYQGALAFEKWTGIFPDIERMKEKVLQQLGGKVC